METFYIAFDGPSKPTELSVKVYIVSVMVPAPNPLTMDERESDQSEKAYPRVHPYRVKGSPTNRLFADRAATANLLVLG